MKKTLFLLASLALTASVQAATVVTFEDIYATYLAGAVNYITKDPISSVITLEDGTKFYVSKSSGKFSLIDDFKGTWTDSVALADMNSVLGTNITSADINAWDYVATTQDGSSTGLKYDFTGNADVRNGTNVIFYFMVAGITCDVDGNMIDDSDYTNLIVEGLSDVSVYYAGDSTNGFELLSLKSGSTDSYEKTFPRGQFGLFKVEGTVSAANNVLFASDTQNNGWAMAAYTVAPTPEPATASLSLLGLAALMMRRRRA